MMCARSESGKRLGAVVASLSAAVDRLQAEPPRPQITRTSHLPLPGRAKKESAA